MNDLARGLHTALVASTLLAAASCGSIAREKTGTSQSAITVCAGATTVEGIDVSHFDGTIDWSMVQSSGRVFAFTKATDGASYVDPTFAANWSGMKQAGLIRGAYHFFEASMDPVAQATFFVQTVGPLAPDDLPPVLDLEQPDGEAGATVAADALTFLSTVATLTGRTPVVYSSAPFVNTTLANPTGLQNSFLWIANWGVSCPNVPAPWTGWTFWQASDTGSVPGAPSGAVTDLDTFNGSLAQLQAFVAGSAFDGGAIGGDGSAGDAGMEAIAGDSGSTTGAGDAETNSDASGIDIDASDGAAPLDGALVGEDDAQADAGGDVSPGADTGKSGGCGCRTAGTNATDSSRAWLAVGALAMLGRSRRRRTLPLRT